MKEVKICVIGLGYVGLPLARLFSTKYKTVGFDMNQKRVEALMAGHDATLEVSDELLQSAIGDGLFVRRILMRSGIAIFMWLQFPHRSMRTTIRT